MNDNKHLEEEMGFKTLEMRSIKLRYDKNQSCENVLASFFSRQGCGQRTRKLIRKERYWEWNAN